MIFSDACNECGRTIAAEDPTTLGYVMAVHLHDDHSEAFDELAEEARTMIEHADDVVDDSAMNPMGAVKKVFGGES